MPGQPIHYPVYFAVLETRRPLYHTARHTRGIFCPVDGIASHSTVVATCSQKRHDAQKHCLVSVLQRVPIYEWSLACMYVVPHREEMVQSCRSRCDKWATEATSDMGRWVREPQPSVFQHTFRDRQPDAELGPANGHVSGRKYIPRWGSCMLSRVSVLPCANQCTTQTTPATMLVVLVV